MKNRYSKYTTADLKNALRIKRAERDSFVIDENRKAAEKCEALIDEMTAELAKRNA